MPKKKQPWLWIGEGYVTLLASFIAIYFLLEEQLELALGVPILILPIIVTVVILLFKNTMLSNFILVPVMIFDGFFHVTSPLENLVANSPDWVIALNLYSGNGMPVLVHQLMGVFLITTSSFFIYFLAVKKKNWYQPFYKYVVSIVTITIISFSYLLKIF